MQIQEKYIKIPVAYGLLLGFCLSIFSSLALAVSNLRFQNFSRELGTEHDAVFAMSRDQQANLWIASKAGLIRFNGNQHNFYPLKLVSPESTVLPGTKDYVRSMLADKKDRLWLGSEHSGLYRYDSKTTTLHSVASIPGKQISVIHDAGAAGLWIAGSEGLTQFDPDTLRVQHFKHNEKDPTSLTDNQVYALAHDQQDNLWVGSANGLDYKQAGSEQFQHYRLDSIQKPDPKRNVILSLLVDAAGDLWIGSQNGLELWSGAKKRRFTSDEGISQNAVNAIYQDQDKQIWLATDDGLKFWDAANGRFTSFRHNLYDSSTLADNRISSIVQDRFGSLWLGSQFAGISRTNLNAFPKNFDAVPNPLTGIFDTQYEQEASRSEKSKYKKTINFDQLDFSYPENYRFIYFVPGLISASDDAKAPSVSMKNNAVFSEDRTGLSSVWHSKNLLYFLIIAAVVCVAALLWYRRRLQQVQQKCVMLELKVRELSIPKLAEVLEPFQPTVMLLPESLQNSQSVSEPVADSAHEIAAKVASRAADSASLEHGKNASATEAGETQQLAPDNSDAGFAQNLQHQIQGVPAAQPVESLALGLSWSAQESRVAQIESQITALDRSVELAQQQTQTVATSNSGHKTVSNPVSNAASKPVADPATQRLAAQGKIAQAQVAASTLQSKAAVDSEEIQLAQVDGISETLLTLLMIAGIDASAALHRCAFNETLYLNLLHQFIKMHADTLVRIEFFLLTEDQQGALALAQKTQKIAENIGASALAQASQTLQQAIEQEQDVTELLQSFSAICALTVAAITQVLSYEPMIVADVIATTPEQSKMYRKHLTKLVANNDVDAFDYFNEHKTTLLAVLGEHGLLIESAINDGDFETALYRLRAFELETESQNVTV